MQKQMNILGLSVDFLFYFHLLPLDKWDWCKAGALNVHLWDIKGIENMRLLN